MENNNRYLTRRSRFTSNKTEITNLKENFLDAKNRISLNIFLR